MLPAKAAQSLHFALALTIAAVLSVYLPSAQAQSPDGFDAAAIDISAHGDFTLSAAPTAFQASTSLHFRLPTAGIASVRVFNSTGQHISTLHEGYRSPGEYTLDWNGTDSRGQRVPSGVYFARVTLGSFSKTIRLVKI